MRLKIALIDAEPHGKRIPRHSLRVPSFLSITTRLQGSVRFPTSAYTDEEPELELQRVEGEAPAPDGDISPPPDIEEPATTQDLEYGALVDL